MNMRIKVGIASPADMAGFGDLVRRIEADIATEINRQIGDENIAEGRGQAFFVGEAVGAAVRNLTRNLR